MAEITVVTQRLFMRAKEVISLTLGDSLVYSDGEPTKHRSYQIQGAFLFESPPSPGGGHTIREDRHICIEFANEREALREFLEIVKQIRDQKPDDKMINSLFEKALTSSKNAEKEEDKLKAKKAKKK